MVIGKIATEEVEDGLELGELVYETGKIRLSKILKVYFQINLLGIISMISLGIVVRVIDSFSSDEINSAVEWWEMILELVPVIYIVPLAFLPVFLWWLCLRPFHEVRIYEEGLIICKDKKEIKIPFYEVASIGNPPASKMMKWLMTFEIVRLLIETNQPMDMIQAHEVIESRRAPSFFNGMGILKVGEKKWYRFKVSEPNVLGFIIFYETLISAYDEWYKRYYKLDDYEEFLKLNQ